MRPVELVGRSCGVDAEDRADAGAQKLPAGDCPGVAGAGRLNPEWERMHARVRAILRKDLFFIVGCQKSGTTWVMKLLGEHPQIYCTGELCFGPFLLPALRQAVATFNERTRYSDPVLRFTDAQLEYLFATSIGMLLGNVLGERAVNCIGEKTPEHALIVPVLAKLFPQAKFVHIVRDGRDAAISGWFYNQKLKGAAFRRQFPELVNYVLLFVQQYWVPYINAARSVARSAPERYFELRYEDLHADLGRVLGPLLRFLDVDASEEVQRRCGERASFEALSGGRRRGECDNQSFYRKGIVGDWKNHFDDLSRAAFERFGGKLLRELGYEV